jgi:two-component system, OmpR family, sensor histidine kinase QseC
MILMAATGLIWLFAFGWIYIGTKQEVESVLDARLQEAARMVASLVTNKSVAAPAGDAEAGRLVEVPIYERQLSCQVWSLDGHLVARSRGAPDKSLNDAGGGFSERLIDGETWRVFTVEDASKGIRVNVGDRLGIREHLVGDIIKGLLAPTLLIVPLLGFLIWASLSRGLRPLRDMAHDLANREAHDMSPVEVGRIPTEIVPVVTSLNGLFSRFEDVRRHERDLTAFAAHELRTPLAGLRTQAQVAIASPDSAIRDAALRQILAAVERTTRLVRQLLAIANLDTNARAKPDALLNLGAIVEEVVDAHPTRADIEIDLDPMLDRMVLAADADLLILALRNLHENAVQHMTGPGTVRWTVRDDWENVAIAVEDDGPGIPSEELHLVTSRFFRGRYKSASGSGLGLAIVELALRSNGARLNLVNRTDRQGLRAEVIWPAKAGSVTAQPGRAALQATTGLRSAVTLS